MNPKIQILGIVNLTDDSYFAPSRVGSCDALVERVGQLVSEGADMVDIGACSTRPGSRPVGAEEEWRRLGPALQALRKAFPDLPVSIDTYWSMVVARVYDLIGPFTVNDISAGAFDPSMLPLVGGLGLPYIAMHMRGTPETMQSLTDYPDGVTAEVLRYFQEFAIRAAEAGFEDWVLDPGFGFAKTVEQNWTLLEELARLPEPDWQAEYRSACVNLGREVQILAPGQAPRRGLALDVGPEAELLVETESGVEAVRSGEVSVRGLYGYLP